MTTTPSGTIDLTDLVVKMKSSFIRAAIMLVLAQIAANPALSWLNLPFIRSIVERALEWVLKVLVDSTLMQAFFLNTAIRKAGQAVDYINAINAKNALPESVSEEDYEKAERFEIDMFNNFVRVAN